MTSARSAGRRWWWLGALALAVISGAAWYATRPRVIAVETTPIVTVYPSQQFVVLTAAGHIVAQRKIAIASKAPGRLAWLGVAEGSRVQAGEVIARLEAGGAQARVGGNARNAIDDTLIRAPFDGIIVAKSADVGDRVTPFSSAADARGAIVIMADIGTLEVEVDVPESGLAMIRVGQPCEITLDGLPDARFRGTVARIVPTIGRTGAAVMAGVHFDAIDPRVLPETSVAVSFLSQPITALQQVPLTAVRPEALSERDGRTVVYLIRGDTAAEVVVAAGRELGGLTTITGDAKSGETAVLRPSPELKAGAPVRARRD